MDSNRGIYLLPVMKRRMKGILQLSSTTSCLVPHVSRIKIKYFPLPTKSEAELKLTPLQSTKIKVRGVH
jgi:hypothetical protein